MPPAAEPLPFALSVYRIVTAEARAALAPLHLYTLRDLHNPSSPNDPGKNDPRGLAERRRFPDTRE